MEFRCCPCKSDCPLVPLDRCPMTIGRLAVKPPAVRYCQRRIHIGECDPCFLSFSVWASGRPRSRGAQIRRLAHPQRERKQRRRRRRQRIPLPAHNPTREGRATEQSTKHFLLSSPPQLLLLSPLRPPPAARAGGHDDAAGGAAGVGVGAGGRGGRRRGGRRARLAGVAPLHPLLPRLRRAPGLPAQRVQHVLPRLPRPARRLLLLLPLPPPRLAPGPPDTAVVVPRRGAGLRGGGRPGHRRRADLRHQQRAGPLPQRAPAAARGRRRRGEGRRVALQLRDLRPRAARPVPLLLPRMQVGGHQEARARGGRRGRQCRRRRRRRRGENGGARPEQERRAAGSGSPAEGDPAPRALLLVTPAVAIARHRSRDGNAEKGRVRRACSLVLTYQNKRYLLPTRKASKAPQPPWKE